MKVRLERTGPVKKGKEGGTTISKGCYMLDGSGLTWCGHITIIVVVHFSFLS